MNPSEYSKKNPPPLQVGDLLYLNNFSETDEVGFGIVCSLYKKGKDRLMMVHWPNSKNRCITEFMEHNIDLVHWSDVVVYYGQ
jgi:hypothetical protein